MSPPAALQSTQPKMHAAAGGRSPAWADCEEEIAPPSIAFAAPRPSSSSSNTGSGQAAGSGGDGNDEGEPDGNPAPQLDGLPARPPKQQRLHPYRHILLRQSFPQSARHCQARPVRINLATGANIKLATVKGWSKERQHPLCTFRGWNPLGQQWEVGKRNNSNVTQPHGVCLFEGTQQECQFWMPGNMPPGRCTHRREFTARDLWDKCPQNRYFGTKGKRHDRDSDLYHRWKLIIATTNVFMAEASVFRLLTWIKQHWGWSEEELWDVFSCTPT